MTALDDRIAALPGIVWHGGVSDGSYYVPAADLLALADKLAKAEARETVLRNALQSIARCIAIAALELKL